MKNHTETDLSVWGQPTRVFAKIPMKISIRRGKQGGQYNCVLRVLGQWVMRTSTKMLHITRFVERLGGTLTLVQQSITSSPRFYHDFLGHHHHHLSKSHHH